MLSKYQIFISSTYEDLKDERDRVIKAILEMSHIPVGMEMFNAADESQWNIIKRRIEESDYYLVIVANRYGSADDDGVSYTEKEYEYAVSKGVPAIGFLLDDSAPWPSNLNDNDPVKKAKLEAFKSKLKKRLVKFWRTKEDLAVNIVLALTPLMTERPRPGWVRGSEVPSAEALNELSRLSKENAELRQQVAEFGEERDVAQVIDSLRGRTISGQLSDKTPINGTLLSFFEAIARELAVEVATTEVGYKFASMRNGKNTSTVRLEFVHEWLKDLALFNLVASRRDERGLYQWWLTSLGKKTLARIGNPEGNNSALGS